MAMARLMAWALFCSSCSSANSPVTMTDMAGRANVKASPMPRAHTYSQ